jgi:uncharacterized protein
MGHLNRLRKDGSATAACNDSPPAPSAPRFAGGRPMRVFITGGTGFIGRTLVHRLAHDGYRVTAWVRDVEKARALLGPGTDLLPTGAPDSVLVETLCGVDAVINLAGAPLLGTRWTATRKEALRSSRVDLTRRLVEALRRATPRPSVLLSASAVGVYGDAGAQILAEESPPGSDFLARLCQDWESEAQTALELGIRVAVMRMGVVLGRGGGALGKMLLPFRMGLGGPIGSGRQFVAWIHLQDLVELFLAAIRDDRFAGAVNVTAPEPVPFRRFAAAIGRALRRPAFLPVPSLVVRMLFGQASAVLLTGQRAVPGRAESLGFRFRFENVEQAVQDLLGGG